MFNYYHECIQLTTPSSSTFWVQVTSAAIALVALLIGILNIISLRNAQSLTAKINLINVEVEMRKSYSEFRNLMFDIEHAKDHDELNKLSKKKSLAMERYVSLSDKLAGLIIFVKNVNQYNKGTEWKKEYLHIFEHVNRTVEGATIIESANVADLQKNVKDLLTQWQQG